MNHEQRSSIPTNQVRRLALVVGVNASDSPSLVPLQFAECDAERMAEVLQTQWTFELFKESLFDYRLEAAQLMRM